MEWEFAILDMLQNIQNPVLTKIMAFITMLGEAGWFWIVLGLSLIHIQMCIRDRHREEQDINVQYAEERKKMGSTQNSVIAQNATEIMKDVYKRQL